MRFAPRFRGLYGKAKTNPQFGRRSRQPGERLARLESLESRRLLAITPYYVNDAAFLAGDWTTAPGNDANDGLMPGTPKATVSAVLAAYDLGAGDVVYVDNGDYLLAADIVIAVQDGGVRIEGFHSTDPAHAGRRALINRGDPSYVTNSIHIDNAANVTLAHLALTGGYVGVSVDGPGAHIQACTIFGNQAIGISVGAQGTQAIVEDCDLFGIPGGTYLDDQQFGATVNVQDRTSFLRNRVHDHGETGVSVRNVTSTTAEQTLLTENTIYNNDLYGVFASGNVRVFKNEVYGQTAYFGGVGIHAQGGVVEENEVYGNYRGISGNQVVGNTVYGNAEVGIFAGSSSRVQNNRVYSNQVGIAVASYGITGPVVANNVLYANADHGIWLNQPNPNYGPVGEVFNNTIFQDSGAAIRVENGSRNASIRNNIFHVGGGSAFSVSDDAQYGFTSDYNLFHVSGTGQVAQWGAFAIPNWLEWRHQVGQDVHGAQADPLFVDPDGPDNVLGYVGGVNWAQPVEHAPIPGGVHQAAIAKVFHIKVSSTFRC